MNPAGEFQICLMNGPMKCTRCHLFTWQHPFQHLFLLFILFFSKKTTQTVKFYVQGSPFLLFPNIWLKHRPHKVPETHEPLCQTDDKRQVLSNRHQAEEAVNWTSLMGQCEQAHGPNWEKKCLWHVRAHLHFQPLCSLHLDLISSLILSFARSNSAVSNCC